jgi:hypothetical protein
MSRTGLVSLVGLASLPIELQKKMGEHQFNGLNKHNLLNP